MEKERKELIEDRDSIVNNADEYAKKDLEKARSTAKLELEAKLAEHKAALDNTHAAVMKTLEQENAAKLAEMEAAGRAQIEQLKEECKRRVAEQRKDLEAKQNTIPDFSANSAIDPATGLPVPTTPIEGIDESSFGDLGTFAVSISKVTVASKDDEKEIQKIQLMEAVMILVACDE